MKLKALEWSLEQVSGFSQPQVLLEQYETPSHIASHILFTAQTEHDDLQGRVVADLGCGCGMLGIGAELLGAATVTGFDLDAAALLTCQDNLAALELCRVSLVQADVLQLLRYPGRWLGSFDTVLLNPPFGTKANQGIDMVFLEVASVLVRTGGSVLSLHKSSTRRHVLKKAKSLGLHGEVMAELRYDLRNTFAFHKKYNIDIEVDCFRFVKFRNGR